MRHNGAFLTGVFILLIMGILIPGDVLGILNQQQSSSQVIFSDGFESYPSTATCNSVNDNCDAPPHIGNATDLPSYWIPASSGTCKTRGGCVTWDGDAYMGPGSVYAVVREEAYSGNNSLKLGASDYYADKTSGAVWLPASDFPSGQPVTFAFDVWLSNGTDNPDCHCNPDGSGPDNAFVIQAPVGKIRYFGQATFNGINEVGAWEIQNSTDPNDLVLLGNYHLTTETWHTITVTFDWTDSVWDALVIDGQQPFAQVNGYPAYLPLVSYFGYVDFALFIDPLADNQSITSAASHGFQPFYAYIDNVNISVGVMTTTSVTTSTTATAFTTTTSSTGTTTSTKATYTATTTLSSPITQTSTIQTTDSTTTTSLAASTTTTTFTSTISTATISATTTVLTGSTTVQTGVTTIGTTASTTTNAATTLTTTTINGTVVISQINTYNVIVTSIIRALYQFAGEVLKLLGIQPVNRPLIRVINRVIVIKPP